MRLNDVALVRLLVFGIILSTALLGAGCSGGSDSSGEDPGDNPPPPPPAEPDLFCEYSRENNIITMTVSFGGDTQWPFYVNLVRVRGSFVGWSDEMAPDWMIVTSDGEQVTFPPRSAGTYEFALKDASWRTVATCSVNVPPWDQTHTSCCFEFHPAAECPNGGVATYIFPLFLAVEECTQGFGPCSGCLPNVGDDGTHPEILLVRGSAVLYAPCMFLEGYLEEGWGPPDGYRDDPTAIWIHECRQ